METYTRSRRRDTVYLPTGHSAPTLRSTYGRRTCRADHTQLLHRTFDAPHKSEGRCHDCRLRPSRHHDSALCHLCTASTGRCWANNRYNHGHACATMLWCPRHRPPALAPFNHAPRAGRACQLICHSQEPLLPSRRSTWRTAPCCRRSCRSDTGYSELPDDLSLWQSWQACMAMSAFQTILAYYSTTADCPQRRTAGAGRAAAPVGVTGSLGAAVRGDALATARGVAGVLVAAS